MLQWFKLFHRLPYSFKVIPLFLIKPLTSNVQEEHYACAFAQFDLPTEGSFLDV